jgi:hypothetical protein
MKRNFLPGLLVFLSLAGGIAWAQSNELRGTWSGHWEPDGGVRDAVTVRFSIVDDELTGEIVNPEGLEFDRISFDSANRSLVAEATGAEEATFKIEARIEEGTRLNGTLTYNGTSGEMKLTKWTYVPRIR